MGEITITAERLNQLREEIPGWLIKDPKKGDYKLDRQIFLDEDIFELEMKYIFEGNWVYVGHESQIANKHDFLTTRIGRQQVLITRQADGTIGGFINVCAHRGARAHREPWPVGDCREPRRTGRGRRGARAGRRLQHPALRLVGMGAAVFPAHVV